MAETALHETAQSRPSASAFAFAFAPEPALPAPEPSVPVSVPVLAAAVSSVAHELALVWLTALAGEDDPVNRDGTPLADLPTAERTLTDLSGRLVWLLLGSPFQPRRAGAIGRSMVSGDFVGADVLGRSLRVLIVRLPALIRNASAGLPDAAPADLEHRIAEVTEALANGYVRALRDRTLAEQESIRRAELDAERILSARLRHQATHDPLTGLPNRAAAFDRLSAALIANSGTRVGLCYLDLDGFKEVNDRHGHNAGDRLLVEVAQRIGRTAAAHDVLAARIGGDEFVVLAEKSPGLRGMIALTSDILAQVSRPVPLPHGPVRVSACAGIADHAAADTTAEAIMSNADAALYTAKSQGAGRWSVHTSHGNIPPRSPRYPATA